VRPGTGASPRRSRSTYLRSSTVVTGTTQSSRNVRTPPVIAVDPGSAADPVHARATRRVRNGLRAAPAEHRSHDQPLIVQPAAVPVHHLRHQRGSAERVRPHPARARTGADRWNIGPHQTGPVEHRAGDCASRWPHRPRRPLQALDFAAGGCPAGPSAVVFPRPGAAVPGFPAPPDLPPGPDPPLHRKTANRTSGDARRL